MCGLELELADSGQSVGTCECSNKPSVFAKYRKFLD
jgi:hypothetical protein